MSRKLKSSILLISVLISITVVSYLIIRPDTSVEDEKALVESSELEPEPESFSVSPAEDLEQSPVATDSVSIDETVQEPEAAALSETAEEIADASDDTGPYIEKPPTEFEPLDLPFIHDFDYEEPWIAYEPLTESYRIVIDVPGPETPEELQPFTDDLLAVILQEIPDLLLEQDSQSGSVQGIVAVTEPQEIDTEVDGESEGIQSIIEIPPFIDIVKPVDDRYYRSRVDVSFSVYDDGDKRASDRIVALSWIGPDGSENALVLTDKNTYSLTYDSSGHKGPLVIKLVAEKDNGLIDERLIKLEEDLKGPSITILSPEANDKIDDSIVIEGSLAPTDSDFAPVDEISSLKLILPGLEDPLDIDFDIDGSFLYELTDHMIDGMGFLTFEAMDYNSHLSSLSIPVFRESLETLSLVPPHIRIDSPEPDSFYYAQIEISGSVFNSEVERVSDKISSFYWSLAGEEVKNKIELNRNGGFTTRITAVDMNRDLQILFTAEKGDGAVSRFLLPLRNDRKGPSITLESPVQDQFYSQSLSVKGTVEDFVGSGNEVKSLYWSVSSRPEERNLIFFEDDGSFHFDINTEFMEGKSVFRIIASDLNNNQTDKSVEINDGKKTPVVILDSPGPEDQYGAGIRVNGKVSDPYSWNPDFGGIESLVVSLSPADAVSTGGSFREAVPLDSSGSFDFILPATGRTGDQNLELLVSARNGNQSYRSIIMSPSEYSIPDLTIEQGDRQLTLNWTELPFIDSYSLEITINGASNDIRGVHSPLVLKELTNGSYYSFHLSGVNGDDIISSPAMGSIPLNERTLEPFALSEYGFIEVSWLPVEGSPSYKVLRADESGAYVDVSGEVSGSRFVDKSGIFGKTYTYKVVPYGYEQVHSYSVEGQLLSEPPVRLTEKGILPNIKPDDLVIDGDYAYVVSEEEGFYIVDISDPEKMAVRGFHMISGGNSITLNNDYAVVTAGSDGFYLINISEPSSPRQVSYRKTSDARGSDILDESIFIADGEKGLKVYSLSNPLRPPRIAADDSFPAYDLTVKGDQLIQSAGESGLIFWDISDPAFPRLIGSYADFPAYDCVVDGNYAYIASKETGVSVLDLSDYENPILCSTYETRNARSLEIKDSHLFIADGEGGLIDLDVSDPYRPVPFESMDLDYASSVASNENIVVVADRRGVLSVESFQYGQSFKIGELKTDGNASSVEVLDGMIYISDHSGGLVLVDGSAPAAIDEKDILYRIPTDYAESVYISENRLFLADGAGGVKIYAIRNGELSLLEIIEVDGQARRAVESGGAIYIASGRGGLQGADAPDRNDPVSAAVEAMPLEADDRELKKTVVWTIPLKDARDIVTVDSYLYCADRQRGLIVLETSMDDIPEIIKEIELPGAIALAVSKNRLFAAHGEGVTVYHIDDKAFPEELTTLQSPFVEDIFVESSILYVAEGHAGLSVYEVKDGGDIIKVSECPDVFADSVTVSGEYAYVADSTGINIIKIHIPEWIRQRQ